MKKKITLTLPNRLAIEDATSMEAAAMLLVMKNMVPSSPSGRSNLRWKKYVIHDLVKSNELGEIFDAREMRKGDFDLQRCQSRRERVQPEQNEQTEH